ncbi:MAG: hypothetical protein ABFR47_06930 [Verrucomicrobiota bacterium]
MKLFASILLLAIVSMLNTACISRTTTSDAPLGKGKDGKVVEKKLIWVWQDEFRNP